MHKVKYPLLLLSLFGIITISCTRAEKPKVDRILSFEQNLIETGEPEFVCRLSEDSILLHEVRDFVFLNDTSFVVVDDRGAYLYHISGAFKKQFGKQGQAGGEYISPGFVYATFDFVYVWCSSLMKMLIFDHEGNFKEQLSGFTRAVRRFVVDANDEVLYLYTSGFFNKSGNKMIDVIDIYNIAEKSSKKYGERSGEDEVLFTWSESGGLYIGIDYLTYLHPGNLIIHHLDLNSGKTVRYGIEDISFQVERVFSIRDIMNNRHEMFDYMNKNSFVRGLHKDNDQFIIVSEIGQFDIDERRQVMENKNRKTKLYVLDSSFNPVRTILYNHIFSPNIVIHNGAMYFLSLSFTEDDTDQIISLNRFPLLDDY
jgi:hypothetical protein